MCDFCSVVKIVDNIYSPAQYEKIIEQINELIKSYGFIVVDGNCEIGKHKDNNGHWIDDIIFHTIKCPKCSQMFTCIVNTYRGGGSFTKGK